MKKNKLSLCLLILFLASCTVVPSPEKRMQAGLEKLSSAQSASYALDVSIMNNKNLVEITGTGQHKAPDQSYLQLTSVGTNFEILALSNNKLYMKDPFSGTWRSIPAGDLTLSGFASDYYSQQLEFLRAYDRPLRDGSETIDGVACDHLKFGILPDKLPQGFLKSILVGINDLTNLSITGELLIGKQDSQPKKSIVQLAIGKDFQLTTTLYYHEFNEELTFPTP